MTNSTTAGPDGQGYCLTAIAKRLNALGVRHVMVIDDALDAGSDEWKDLLPGVQDEIRTFIEGIPELEEWLKQENLSPPASAASPEAEQYLEKLKPRVSEREDLLMVWNGYIAPSVGTAREEVEELIECLRKLGITVQPSGIRDPKDPPADLSVIFIDYTLDDANLEDLAATSIAEINRIHDALTTPSRPIVVLMSSRTKLSSELKIRFRDETGIMAGMFFGFQKDELKGMSLHIILNDIAEHWPKAVALQSFVHTVSEASQDAAHQVSSLVRRLTLEDFALIQLLSLNADGQPLGEYLLWLAGAYFKQQLGSGEGVQISKTDVDRMVFAALPSTEWGPSDAFLSAYRAAIFADADSDISSNRYPALDEEAKKLSGNPNDIVALHFGDVFVQDMNAPPRAYIVMTPECDLAFGGSRPFPRKHSVVLIPGEMIPGRPFTMSGENTARTELLHWNDEDWKIQWKVKEAQTVSLDAFKKSAEQLGLNRVARVEFSFAADVQRAYVGDLSRIGLPVVPPQFQGQDVMVYVEDGNQAFQVVCGPIPDGAYLFSSPQYGQWKCVLSRQLLRELQGNLPKAIELAKLMPTPEDLEKTPEAKKEERLRNATDRVANNTKDLETLSESLEAISALRGPHDLDNPTGEVILSSVTISNKPRITASHAKTVLTIHLNMPGDVDPSTTELDGGV